MADYTKKTVAELTEMLKSRGLPHSGKKAELVARLSESDKVAEAAPAEETAPIEEAASEEVVVDDTAAATVAQPESAAQTAPTPPEVVAEQAADADTDASQNHEATDHGATDADVSSKQYTLNLASSDVNSELEKRKARAARFGTGGGQTQADNAETANGSTTATATAPTDGDALKTLERAKRFGGGQAAIGKLDEALSTERETRGKKRGHGAIAEPNAGTMDDPGLLRKAGTVGGRGRGRFPGRGGHGKPDGSRPTGVSKPRGGAFSSDKDRSAAESRKKRFATA